VLRTGGQEKRHWGHSLLGIAEDLGQKTKTPAVVQTVGGGERPQLFLWGLGEAGYGVAFEVLGFRGLLTCPNGRNSETNNIGMEGKEKWGRRKRRKKRVGDTTKEHGYSDDLIKTDGAGSTV